MDSISWLDHPSLQTMDVRKKQLLIDLITESAGKPMAQAFPILMTTQNKLKENGLSFTHEESALIMALLSKDLTPTEKSKLEAMKKVMNPH